MDVNHIATGKSPDNMSRAELLTCIAERRHDRQDAMNFWLKYAAAKVSRKAFERAIQSDKQTN